MRENKGITGPVTLGSERYQPFWLEARKWRRCFVSSVFAACLLQRYDETMAVSIKQKRVLT
jgi:hypothetical protein